MALSKRVKLALGTGGLAAMALFGAGGTALAAGGGDGHTELRIVDSGTTATAAVDGGTGVKAHDGRDCPNRSGAQTTAEAADAR